MMALHSYINTNRKFIYSLITLFFFLSCFALPDCPSDETKRLYSGQFRNGYPNGKGCWIEANGDKYVGQFQDGEYHGRGYKISGSVVATGVWKEGELVKGETWVERNKTMYKVS